MTQHRSPYEVLGIDPSASDAEVDEAFRSAMRARAHPARDVRHASRELGDPVRRLHHDVLELPPAGIRERLERLLATAEGGSVIDERTAPLPAWADLVQLGLGGAEVVERPVAAPDRTFPVADRRAPVPRDVVPPFEFPVLP